MSLNLSDIQGNIIRGYNLPCSRHLFVRVDRVTAGGKLVQWLAPRVTNADQWREGKPDYTINVGLSYQGLEALGLPDSSLSTFPDEFREGMEQRADLLGDNGESAPRHWDSVWHDRQVHIWISIHAIQQEELQDQHDKIQALIDDIGGVSILDHQDAARLVIDGKVTGTEHFGYRDGFGQPSIEGSGVEPRPGQGKLTEDGNWEPLKAGEFLLGHPDEAGELPRAPSPQTLAANGTFAAYRKLHQKVATFRQYLEQQGENFPGGPERLAAKIVGRWRDGTPAELSPDATAPKIVSDSDKNNDFRYSDDAQGSRCPLGAHVRRANPRDAQGFGGRLAYRRRIIRRGMAYGTWTPPDQPVPEDADCGLLFIAINASLERQFEFVLANWINNGNNFSQGNDKDILVGNHDGTGRAIIQGDPENPDQHPPIVCAKIPRFVTTRGGEYFFIPGLRALRMIASGNFDSENEPLESGPGEETLVRPNPPEADPAFNRPLVWVWVFQALALLGWGSTMWLLPERTLKLLTSEAFSPFGPDMTRMVAPWLVTLGMFTLYGLMTTHVGMQRSFTRVFTGFWLLWAPVFWWVFSTGRYGNFTFAIGIVGSLLGLINLLALLLDDSPEVRRSLGGCADSKPPQLWVVWFAQALVVGSVVVPFTFFPEATMQLISGQSLDQIGQIALDRCRMLGIWPMGVVLVTVLALYQTRDWIWRGFAFFFCIWEVLWILTYFVVDSTGRYNIFSLGVLIPAVVFLALNLWFMRKRTPWYEEQIEPSTDGWGVIDLVAGPLMGLSVLKTRRRSSHLYGVGARGTFSVAKKPTFPLNDFFSPGRQYPVIMRFATLTEKDDASMDVRGCSVKFSKNSDESPLDLLMNTGGFTAPYNVVKFAQIVSAKFVPRKMLAGALKRDLVAREGTIAGLRRAPESFLKLIYYSQIVRFWTDTDNRRHLVRYRWVPAGLKQESGLPDEWDIANLWNPKRKVDETRPANYLREELKQRLTGKPETMILQAQFHTPEAGDTLEWFNASLEWSEQYNQWHEVGRARLTSPLTDEETEQLKINPGNHPQSLTIPIARGPFDYRSMGDSEQRVVKVLQRLRFWLYRVFGLPRLDR